MQMTSIPLNQCQRIIFRLQRTHWVLKKLMVVLMVCIPYWAITQIPLSQAPIWEANRNSVPRVFLPNEGQVDQIPGYSGSEILYIHDDGTEFYFRRNGISIALYKGESRDDSERINANIQAGIPKEIEESAHKRFVHRKFIHLEWEGSNPNPEITRSDSVAPYWNFPNPLDENQSINFVRGYQKLTYKNVYPNIDIEFSIHPENGIKYACRLHPGANPLDIQMRYDSISDIRIDSSGNLIILADGIQLMDHAPETVDEEGNILSSHFTLSGNTAGFQIEPYDLSKTIIIDPWITGVFMNQYFPAEISKDSSDNVYIYGWRGNQPNTILLNHFVQKYSPSGILLWTYQFPFQNNFNRYSGEIITDKNGNSYISNGFSASIQTTAILKLNTNAVVQWNISQSANMFEIWRLNFNCDQSEVIATGCARNCCNVWGGIPVNPSTGAGLIPFVDSRFGDIVSSYFGIDNHLYTLNVGKTNGANPMLIKSNPSNLFQILYSIPINRILNDGSTPQIYGPIGFNAISTNCDHIFMNFGDSLIKRNLSTGNFISNVRIPNGVFKGNSGISVDYCGNIYVGSFNGVYVFDSNLNLHHHYPTPFTVTDIVLSGNHTLYACGGQQSGPSFLACFNTYFPQCDDPIGINISHPLCNNPFSTATAIPRSCGPAFNYTWNTTPIQTTQTATGLNPGTYQVMVSGVSGCSATIPVRIDSGMYSSINVIPVSCPGGNDGSASVQIYNGRPPYTVQWLTQPIQSGMTATGLAAGTYTLQITDSNSCQINTVFQISQPNPIQVSDTIQLPTCAGQNNGSISIQTTGGNPGYSYSWNAQPAQTSTVLTGLSGGTYSLILTDSLGCQYIHPPIPILPPAPFSSQSVQTTDNCPNNPNGSIQVFISGGTPGYSYSWNTQPIQTTAQATGLGAGSYSLLITDANGCHFQDTFSILQGIYPIVSLGSDTLLCYGDSNGLLLVQIQNGSPPYSFVWNSLPLVTSSSASNLIAGTYHVLVTQGNTCTWNLTGQVFQPNPLQIQTSSNQVYCFGATTGIASVLVFGGTTPYSYTWLTNPIQTFSQAIGLGAGTYAVHIQDANQCTIRDTLTILSPPPLLANSIIVPQSCLTQIDGRAEVIIQGGYPPYQYAWNTIPIQTTAIATGLSQGNISCLVTDSAGCTLQINLPIPIQAPIQIQEIIHPVSCTGGSNGMTTLVVSGGTPSYSYSWAHDLQNTTQTATGLSSGSYSVTIQDVNGCSYTRILLVPEVNPLSATVHTMPVSCHSNADGVAVVNVQGGNIPYSYSWNTNPVQTTAIATGLNMGSIECTITDVAGCTQRVSAFIDSILQIQTVAFETPISCYGLQDGMISLTSTGGVSPYSYLWLPGNTSGNSLSNIGQGTYTVLTKDNAGCLDTLTVSLSHPDSLSLILSADSVRCRQTASGMAYVQVLGGNGPYTYTWNSIPPTHNDTLSNQMPGTYQVRVQDANACTQTGIISIHDQDSILVSSQVHTISCKGNSDGDIGIAIQGGNPPFQYLWSNGASAASIQNLGAGNYSVIIRDRNDCIHQRSYTLTEPDSLQAQISLTHPSCNFTTPDGSICLSVQGGYSPYQYSWQHDANLSSACATGLISGHYPVSILDARGCALQRNLELNAPEIPLAIAGNDTFMCENSEGVSLSGMGSGGRLPYTFEWSPNNGSLSNPHQSNSFANPDTTTLYSLIVIDEAGCVSLPSYQKVTVYPLPIADAGLDLNYCKEGPAVFLQGNITNATGQYSVNWTPASAVYCDTCLMTYATPDSTTLMTLWVTDLNTGCSSLNTTLNTLSTCLIHVKPRPIADAGSDKTICENDTASICAFVSGAGPNYSYLWSPTQQIIANTGPCVQVTPTHSMIYYLTVESDGCYSIADTVQVIIQPIPTVDAGNTSHICLGDSIQLNGIIQQGSNPTLTWYPALGLDNASILNPTASPLQTQWYYFQASQGTCMGTADSTQIIVHARPSIDIRSDTTICEGEQIQINTHCVNCDATVSFQWHPPIGLNSSTHPSPIASPSVSTFYFLEAKQGIGGTICSGKDSVLIQVISSPLARIHTDTTVLCEGDSIGLTALGNDPTIKHSWHTSGGWMQEGNPINIKPNKSQTYKLVSELNGCKDSMNIALTVNPTPQAAFSLSQPEGCAPHLVRFQNQSALADYYIWKFGENSIWSNEVNPEYVFEQPGNYSIQLTAIAKGGCRDSARSNLPIKIYPGIQPKFISNPDFPISLTTPCAPIRMEDLTESVIERTWYLGDGNSANGKSISHTYKHPGRFEVELETKNELNCVNRKTIGIVTVLSPELFIPNVFSPNNDGVSDFFLIEYSGDEAIHIKILDRWGVLVFETRNKQESWNGNNLNGQASQEGVYFYAVTIGSKGYSGNITLVR